MERCHWLLIMLLSLSTTVAMTSSSPSVKSSTFMTEKIKLSPGLVFNRTFFNISFPRGHIGVKTFTADLVDESGRSVPLYEAYLHHWLSFPYKSTPGKGIKGFSYIRNAGVCQGHILGQTFGLGSDIKKMPIHLPGPYVTEVGNSEEWWALNIQIIDTRGVEDRIGCTECRCDLFNVTKDPWGRALMPGYKGGQLCCYDQTQCRLGKDKGSHAPNRTVFLKYTVTYLDWSHDLIPVSLYLLDITDDSYGKPVVNGTHHHDCRVEYDIAESCSASKQCVDTRKSKMYIRKGGYLIYSSGHQNMGGIGTTLSTEEGKVMCKSYPIYGRGREPGNEAGYVVGTKGCYYKPGTVKIQDMQTLLMESNYDSKRAHTAVVGIFSLVLADRLPK